MNQRALLYAAANVAVAVSSGVVATLVVNAFFGLGLLVSVPVTMLISSVLWWRFRRWHDRADQAEAEAREHEATDGRSS